MIAFEYFGSGENLANQSYKVAMEPRALLLTRHGSPRGVSLVNGRFFEYMNSKGSRGCTPWIASPSGGAWGSPSQIRCRVIGMICTKQKNTIMIRLKLFRSGSNQKAVLPKPYFLPSLKTPKRTMATTTAMTGSTGGSGVSDPAGFCGRNVISVEANPPSENWSRSTGELTTYTV